MIYVIEEIGPAFDDVEKNLQDSSVKEIQNKDKNYTLLAVNQTALSLI